MENKKKMNPYMKAVVIILFASILGSVIGFTQAFFDEGISGLLQSIGLWIASNSVLLFLCVFVIGILCGIFWYVKAASVERKIESLDDREEEQIDRLDYRFDVNVNLGMLVSNVALILGMVFMGTAFGYGMSRERILIVAVVLTAVTYVLMQVHYIVHCIWLSKSKLNN